jgi:hypothetical protein
MLTRDCEWCASDLVIERVSCYPSRAFTRTSGMVLCVIRSSEWILRGKVYGSLKTVGWTVCLRGKCDWRTSGRPHLETAFIDSNDRPSHLRMIPSASTILPLYVSVRCSARLSSLEVAAASVEGGFKWSMDWSGRSVQFSVFVIKSGKACSRQIIIDSLFILIVEEE